MRYYVTAAGRSFEVEIAPGGTTIDGVVVDATLEHVDGTPVRGLLVDGRSRALIAERDAKGGWKVRMGGSAADVTVVDERTKVIREMAGAGAAPTGPKPIVAPMPGKVIRVEVSEGDRVVAGQGVAIVEAMKMENELRSLGPGVVTRVRVSEGETVEKDQVLVELAPVDDGQG